MARHVRVLQSPDSVMFSALDRSRPRADVPYPNCVPLAEAEAQPTEVVRRYQ